MQMYTPNDLQIHRLTNEVEELRLEREESKKNVLHFMQEADSLRHELERAQELIKKLTSAHWGEFFSSQHYDEKRIGLFSKLNQLSDTKITQLFDLLENSPDNRQLSRNQANSTFGKELDPEVVSSTAALSKDEDGKIEIKKLEKSQFEEANCTIQLLQKEITALRASLLQKSSSNYHTMTIKQETLRTSDSQSLSIATVQKEYKLKLDQQIEQISKHWHEKYNKITIQNIQLEKKQLELSSQAKARENHLKTVNKMLQDELRKLNRVQGDNINVEYLRNVIIKFLERQNTRAQLIPILSTLLKCSTEDQSRLSRLVRNKLTSY
ncbi:MAG: hypothetical protein EXX96DRAFT_390356 [Benjaminiella poitrasii]|nr:MAG: hypothetical protein EXX96DRAFT_390356 [Benjaminiella poitrasii]